MHGFIKQISIVSLVLFFTVAGFSATRAANLTGVAISATSHKASAVAVAYTLRFKPTTSIAAPGTLKITFPGDYNLASVAASADVTVSGGGVVWEAVVNGNLNTTTRVLTLGWSSGTLTIGNQVTVTVNFVKNPTIVGTYSLLIQTGASGFETATDSRTVPFVITDSGVAVSAIVASPAANPTITTIDPTPTIVVADGDSQVVTFVLSDLNDDALTYTITSNSNNTASVGSPVSPITNTRNGITITFTYFTDVGTATGSQTVTITADDADATGGPLVSQDIDFFII